GLLRGGLGPRDRVGRSGRGGERQQGDEEPARAGHRGPERARDVENLPADANGLPGLEVGVRDRLVAAVTEQDVHRAPGPSPGAFERSTIETREGAGFYEAPVRTTEPGGLTSGGEHRFR